VYLPRLFGRERQSTENAVMVEIGRLRADCHVHGQSNSRGSGVRPAQSDYGAAHRDARSRALPTATWSRCPSSRSRATSLRGDRERDERRRARRLHTQTTRVEVEVGRTESRKGARHVDVRTARLGPAPSAWVPLTEARVMYRCGENDVSEEMATLLVNRHLMRSFQRRRGRLDFRGSLPERKDSR